MKLFRKIITMALLPNLMMPWYMPTLAWASGSSGGSGMMSGDSGDSGDSGGNGGSGSSGGSSATVTIAPNLMIVMANSSSMAKEFDDQTYPPRVAGWSNKIFQYLGVDYGDPGDVDADQPLSKFYIAKQTLVSLLNGTATNNINLGFATFRTIYGVPEWLAQYPGNVGTGAGYDALPDSPGDYALSTPAATTLASDPRNFSATSDYNIRLSPSRFPSGSGCASSALNSNGISDYGAILGNTFCDGGNNVINDAAQVCSTSESIITSTPGGCISSTIAPTYLTASTNGWGNGTGTGGTSTGVGGLPAILQPSGSANYYLCNVSFNSQNNRFYASYYTDLPVTTPGSIGLGTGTFNAGEAGTPTLHPFSCASWASNWLPTRSIVWNGSTVSVPQGDVVGVSNGLLGSKTLLQTTWYAPANLHSRMASTSWTATNIYGNVGLGFGTATHPVDGGNLLGWSGETSYTCTVNGVVNTRNGCINPNAPGVAQTWTANFPSGAADPDGPNRNLVANGLIINNNWAEQSSGNKNPLSHMGAFVDLPLPSFGYRDQRSTIIGLLGYVQMRDDGQDYNPQPQTMAPNSQASQAGPATNQPYGISISAKDPGTGSNIYDSLQDALAYFTAYKAQDPYKNCRSNNVLLMIDGKEDARVWTTTVNGVTQNQYADPVQAATALYNSGVNIYVVLMTSATGDVAQANAIARAGGTVQAYQAGNATALASALASVFQSMANQVNTAPVAVPPTLSSGGSYVYQSIDSISPSQGHVDAFSVSGGGVLSATPAWDAAAAESISARTSALFSTGVSTGSTPGSLTFLTNLDTAAFNILPPNTTSIIPTIVDYTINPSYPCTSGCTQGLGSPYLGARAPNAYFGLIGNPNQSGEQFSQSLQYFNPPNDFSLASNTSYMTWASQTAQTQRPPELIFPDQDGFLYGIYQNGQPVSNPTPSGQLAWGWMPRGFVANLQQNLGGTDAFANNGYGNGAELVVDAQSISQQWASYVAGTLAGTQDNYALRMGANGMPGSVVYDDWRPQPSRVTLPKVTPPAYFRLQNGSTNLTYVVYVTTNAAGQAVVVERELDTSIEPVPELPLGFVPTSNYFILNNELFLGDGSGNLYGIPLANGTVLNSTLSLTTIGSFFDPAYATDADHAIAYVGGIMEGGVPYLYAASSTRITVFNQAAAPATNWYADWTSYVSGAGTWSTSGTYTPSTAGLASAGSAPSSGIQFLPLNALITDNPVIVNNALIVPVTVNATTTSICSPGSAYDYLYSLLSGAFPGGTFTMLPTGGSPIGSAVINNIYIGNGTAYSTSGSGATGGVYLYSNSSQSTTSTNSSQLGVPPGASFTTGLPGNQLIWWQILNN